SLAPCIRVVVRVATLSPATIRVLHHPKPFRSLLDIWLMWIDPNCFEPSQHQHRARDVIHAPAAKPTAIRLLLFPYKIDCLAHRRVVLVVSVAGLHLTHSPAHLA